MTAYQDSSLVAELTVAENLELSFHCLGEEAPKDLRAILADFDLPFGQGDLVGELGPGGRQMLEVVRSVVHQPKVLLLDEPTAVLDVPAAEKLQTLIRRIRDEGCAVVYVSHRLEEVRRLADRLTVLRDGVIQGTHSSMDWDVDHIVELMVGAAVDLEFPPRPDVAREDRPTVFDVKDLRAPGMGPVSIDVGRGEIVGIAGAEGSGQRQLLRALVGMGRKSGSVQVNGKGVPASPSGALRAGVNFQSGDRVAESVFPSMTVADNSTIQLGSELGPAGLNLPSEGLPPFKKVVKDLGIVIASPFQPIGALSGGNQQKVVLSRAALRSPEVLIIDEPTQGVDAKARLDIYHLITRVADDGVAVLVNSSDSSELAGLCDRVYVMSDGSIIDEVAGDLTESGIVRRFVSTTEKPEQVVEEESKASKRFARLLVSPWVPVAVLAALTVLLSVYAGARAPLFYESFNLNNLLLSALPLVWIAIGQQFCLLVGELDISIGATATLSVVISSFLLDTGSVGGLVVGFAAVLAAAVAVGLFNSFLTQYLKVSPLIATIGTLGIVTGICILLRPQPGGAMDVNLGLNLSRGLGWVPFGFVLVVLVALAMDVWLFRSGGGLSSRSVGLRQDASLRVGVRVARIKAAGYIVAALGAVVGGIFLAAQVGVGSNDVGLGLSLPAFASCFLGGAVLTGGRGTFVGAALGAVFLSVITNAAQALTIPFAWTQIVYGVILLAAVAIYSLAARAAQASR
jgi:ribose transport system ATP-binding protein